MQLVDENACLRFDSIGEFDDPFVVGEQQHLSDGRQLCQNFKTDSGAVIIEADEDIVHHKRHRLSFAQMLLEGRQPQRQVKLISRSVAHAFDDYFFAVGSDTEQEGLALFIQLIPEIHIGPQSEPGEENAGSGQQRRLIFTPIFLDFFFQHETSNAQAKVLLETIDDVSQMLLRLLGELCGERASVL